MARGRQSTLHNVPLDEAQRRFWGALEEAGWACPLPGESVPVAEALGRVTAASVGALVSSPHYPACAMDGVAVRAEDTSGSTETAPRRLRVPEEAVWVDTGDPLPHVFDAVIMVEQVRRVGDAEIEIAQAAAAGQNVRPVGEDFVAGELLLREGQLLGPVDLGVAAASGRAQVDVRRRPRVLILPTGDELVEPGARLEAGSVVELNSLILAAQVREWGGDPTRLPPARDDLDLIMGAVASALEDHDVVVVNAGSSRGADDYTATVIDELGELVVHGVAIRPGHPVALGVCRAKPVLGIPGYPVAAALTSELLLRPLLRRLLALPAAERSRVRATLDQTVRSAAEDDEFVQVKLARVSGRLLATPLRRGAGAITSLMRADGLVRIPRRTQGFPAGAWVEVELSRPHGQIPGVDLEMA